MSLKNKILYRPFLQQRSSVEISDKLSVNDSCGLQQRCSEGKVEVEENSYERERKEREKNAGREESSQVVEDLD
jgi:hypothetical protein